MGLNGDNYASKVCKYCGTALGNDSNICPWCHKAQDESEVSEVNTETKASVETYVENKNSSNSKKEKESNIYFEFIKALLVWGVHIVYRIILSVIVLSIIFFAIYGLLVFIENGGFDLIIY